MKDSLKIKPIRPFAIKDIPEVADMFKRLLLSEGPSRRELTNDILDCLFNHALRHGSAAITGRLYPRYMHELSEKRCYFHRNGSWVLVHSNNDELLNIIHRGDAFLTSLEGECCLLF